MRAELAGKPFVPSHECAISPGMLSYNTIQELIDGGYTLEAYCHNSRCHHHGKLDLHSLRDKLGPDYSTLHDDLVPKLKCAKCGGKDVGLIRSPPSPDPYPMRAR